MNVYKINRDSWHYRVIREFTMYEYDPTNLCEYVRQFVVGCGIVLLYMAVLGMAAGCICDFVIWLVVMAVQGQLMYPDVPGGGAGVVLATIAGITIWGYFKKGVIYISKWTLSETTGWNPPTQQKQPSFLKTWYLAHKEKYCVKVEFE